MASLNGKRMPQDGSTDKMMIENVIVGFLYIFKINRLFNALLPFDSHEMHRQKQIKNFRDVFLYLIVLKPQRKYWINKDYGINEYRRIFKQNVNAL